MFDGRRDLIIHLLFSARPKLCRPDYAAYLYRRSIPTDGNLIYRRRTRFPLAFYLEQTSKLIPNVLPLHPPVRRLKTTYLLHLPDIPADIDRAKRALNALV